VILLRDYEMRTPGHNVATIRLVGEHPALDLLNTVDTDRPNAEQDVLRSFKDDATWAVRLGLLSAPEGQHLIDLGQREPAAAERAHVALVQFREVFRAIIRNDVEGGKPPRSAATHFERTVVAALASRRFSLAEHSLGWTWAADDIDAVQHRIAFSAAELLTDTRRQRIRECAGPDCEWYFLDTSRSGNRRWCSDAGCGTADRVRRLRRRRDKSD
jgi:predicted RNA-binding Zn ribbon-like protein